MKGSANLHALTINKKDVSTQEYNQTWEILGRFLFAAYQTLSLQQKTSHESKAQLFFLAY